MCFRKLRRMTPHDEPIADVSAHIHDYPLSLPRRRALDFMIAATALIVSWKERWDMYSTGKSLIGVAEESQHPNRAHLRLEGSFHKVDMGRLRGIYLRTISLD